jgi:hypothetical protein
MFDKTVVALSIAIALSSTSAALAGTPSKRHRHMSPSTATAWTMAPSRQVRHSSNPAFDVYDITGRYIGSDPDSFIRSQLARDPRPGD